MELAALVEAEARHCPFLTWALDDSRPSAGGSPLVRIQASTEHPDDIDGIVFLVGAQIAATQIAPVADVA